MSILAALLPQDCLLCGEGNLRDLLCPACVRDLPQLPECRCPVCAETLPVPATCGACLGYPPDFDATLSPFRYTFPVDKLIQELKFGRRLAVAGYLAGAMADGARPEGELMIPVPLSAARLRERGFNQALEIARPLARRLGVPLLLDACIRSQDTLPQASLPWPARRRNVRHAFECSADLAGRTVIVVDDVMTSGATLNEFAGVLKAHGAARVINWVAARALRN